MSPSGVCKVFAPLFHEQQRLTFYFLLNYFETSQRFLYETSLNQVYIIFILFTASSNLLYLALIVSTRVELDPSKEHVYGVVRIEKGGVLTSSSASALILNAQVLNSVFCFSIYFMYLSSLSEVVYLMYSFKVLDVQAGGRIDLNGKGHAGGVSIPPESNGYAYQGVSPTGGSGPNLYSNGGGGGGGQGGGNFGSTGGGMSACFVPRICTGSYNNFAIVGGGGYGTAGSIGATNSHNSKRNNSGGFAGSTYGEPGLAVIHLGSGGMNPVLL